jgi:hypothetical protein
MEEEKSKNDIHEKITVISATERIEAEALKMQAEALKIQAEALKTMREVQKMEIENNFLAQKLQIEIDRRKKAYNVIDMYMLSAVMSTVIGNGSESYSTSRLFSDDDLIDYKAKMRKMLDEI